MIAKITTGSGLRGALNYDLLPKKGKQARARWVAGTLTGTPQEMSRQAAPLRGLRPTIAAPIWRCSLSLPHADGRRSPDFWSKIGTEFLIEMGVDPCTAGWCMVQHDDRDHDHAHISLIRCQADGSLFDRANDVKRAIKVTQLLEQRHQLHTHSRDPPHKSNPTLRDREISKRTEKPMSKIFIQEKIDAIFAAKPHGLDFAELNSMLGADIIDAAEKRTAKGKLQGISFRFNGVAVPASELGSQYSTKGLMARGLRIAEFVKAPTAESNSTKQTPAEQITLPAKTAPAAPAQQENDLDRPLQQLQQISQAMYPAQQMHAPGPVVKRLGEVSDRLDQMAPAMNTPFLNCSWALARLLVEASKMAFALGAALLRFLKNVLSYFGLATREPLQFQKQAVTPQLTYNPTQHGLVLNEEELKELDKTATAAVNGVLNAVVNNKPNDLAAVPGRAELVAAMAAENIKTGTPAVAESHPLDSMFDAHVTQPAPKIEPDAAQPDTLVLLNTAKKEFFTASIQKSDAREKETNQVVAARKNHEMAVRRLKQAKLDYLKEKERKGRWAFLLPSEAVVVEDEQIEFDRAELGLANAIQQHPIVVPPELVQKFGDALEKVKTAAQMHHAQMVRDVAKFDNAKVKKIAVYQAQSFKANFEIFERAPQVGYLDIAFKVAEAAPNSISTAQNLAEREEKIRAERQAYVPKDENVDNIERPGQK